MRRLSAYAGFVKLEHTVFSLPLIYAGAFLHGGVSVRIAILILLAALGGRVMAMGLNRIIDAAIDARNPRTKGRELPRGILARWEAWLVVGLAGVLYLGSAAAIAPICVRLAPIPIIVFVLYPYLKRFTTLCHAGLGLAWSLAPVGGWLASARSVQGIGETAGLWGFSTLWVTGFDIIYATLDEAFDRESGLFSLPAKLGKTRALRLAAGVHAGAFLALAVLWWTRLRSPAAFGWLAAIGFLFIWQHAVAARRPAFAFFQLNGAIGCLVLGLVLAGRP